MKEFSAQTGGRYTYADDLENLQDLALAFAQIFDDCDNFIISGCEVASGAISAGYVFLNGKLRYFSGATGISSWPQYIYESNFTENVTYESGGSKTGRNVYGCVLGSSVPVTKDTLTGKAIQSIVIRATGGLRMKDAFIGKYALLLNPANSPQTVDSIVNFAKAINANGDLTANSKVTIRSGAIKTEFNYAGSTFNVKYTGNTNTYQLSFVDGVGVRVYVNNTLTAVITDSAIVFNKPVSAEEGRFGGLVLTGNQLYQGSANSTSEININLYGYNGTSTQARNAHIGNGQGRRLLSVWGTTGAIDINGVTTVAAGATDGLILKANLQKTNTNLVNAISWRDSENTVMARAGFLGQTNQTFNILALFHNIEITGYRTVNIGPAIMENGTLLSEKYVLATTFTQQMSLKANASSVYSITNADARFAIKTGGLSQFVSATVTAATCRTQIGALGQSDLANYAKISSCLADMATDDNKKAQIRKNIGAAGTGDFQEKLTDSGWKHIKDSLYVRQIGNMVCVQGSTKTIHSGTVFTIPNTIAPPAHAVKHSIAFGNKDSWVCKIAANQRACTVVYCNGNCGRTTEFSITYMV